jgi:hypothetical protein
MSTATREACSDVRAWQAERTAERAWDMALFSFRQATQDICEMAKSPEYRDRAVSDLGPIAEAVLAANLMWSQLKAREAV